VGILERINTQYRCSLAAQLLVGRSTQCILRIEDPRVSGVHAMIRWVRSVWEIRDLSSSNGTIVDGRKLSPSDRVDLRVGSEVRFAGGDPWVLVSALPPIASATSASGQVVQAESGLLVLPDEARPVACVYEDADGLMWIEVDGGAARLAVDQETIVAGEPWVLSVPPPLPNASISTTLRLDRTLVLECVTLRFRHSADEEHVEMSIVHDDGVTPPLVRAYQYALLTLARRRLSDRDAGLLPAEQGWMYVEELLVMLQMDAERLNVDIHRARKELAQIGLIDAGAVVQRRPGSRQIRLGTGRVEIIRF
jgi:FHA domain